MEHIEQLQHFITANAPNNSSLNNAIQSLQELREEQLRYEFMLKKLETEIRINSNFIKKTVQELEATNKKLVESNKELVEVNTKLQVKNQQMEEFTYIASHDLQEPLRTIQSLAERIIRRGETDPTSRKMLEFLNQSTQRMSRLVKGIMAHLNIGKTPERTLVNCNKVITVVLNDLLASITECDAVFEIDTLPTTSAYETELRQLFQNLIANAIKYRTPNTTPVVKVSVEENDNYYTFCFQDNGIGIEQEYKELIFKIFQRLHNNKTYTGTGIGLANCKKIVELHEGDIWVESTLGQGSSFYFTIKKS